MAKKRKRKENRYLKDIIEKRYTFLVIFIIVLFTVIVFRLFNLQILNSSKYQEKLNMNPGWNWHKLKKKKLN